MSVANWFNLLLIQSLIIQHIDLDEIIINCSVILSFASQTAL